MNALGASWVELWAYNFKSKVPFPPQATINKLCPTDQASTDILGAFPIVRREDEAQFGKYRTRDLVLAYMNALSAGDTKTVVSV